MKSDNGGQALRPEPQVPVYILLDDGQQDALSFSTE